MKVTIALPSLGREFGGPPAKAGSLASGLRDLGVDVTLVGAGDGSRGAVGLGRVGAFHGTPVPFRFDRLWRECAGSDLIHVIGYRDPVGTASAFLARTYRTPFVLEPVGMIPRGSRSRTLKAVFDGSVGKLLQGRSIVVASSQTEFQDLVAAGIAPYRIRLRPNGVDASVLLPLPERGSFRRRLSIAPEAPMVLTLSRFAGTKGLDVFARALRYLPEEVRWVVAGPSEDGRVVGSLRDSEARERISLVPGGLWGDDKRAALADTDAFCLPSPRESFGSAAAEAACCGIPTVVTDGCGMATSAPELLIARAGDAEDLAARTREALFDPDVRANSAEAASALRDRLSWPALCEQQLEIYREALALR